MSILPKPKDPIPPYELAYDIKIKSRKCQLLAMEHKVNNYKIIMFSILIHLFYTKPL